MDKETKAQGGGPVEPVAAPAAVYLEALRSREGELIQRRREAVTAQDPAPHPSAEGPPLGLALSGRGIRSATFCLGVLQGMARARLQARLGAQPGVADLHAFLMAVFVQQAGRVQVQHVAAGPAGPPFQTPTPPRPEGGQVLSGAGAALEEGGETGLAAHALDGLQDRQQDVAAQVGQLGQLLRAGQDARREAQGQVGHGDDPGLVVGQDMGQQISEAVPRFPTGARLRPCWWADEQGASYLSAWKCAARQPISMMIPAC